MRPSGTGVRYSRSVNLRKLYLDIQLHTSLHVLTGERVYVGVTRNRIASIVLDFVLMRKVRINLCAN